jgi:hypothetical protein
MARKTGPGGPSGPTIRAVRPEPLLPTERELICITEPPAQIRARAARVESLSGANTSALNDALRQAGARMRPLFGETEERVRQRMAAVSPSAREGAELPDLSTFYRVEAPEDRLEELAAQLRRTRGVAGAYVKPGAQPAAVEMSDAQQFLGPLNSMTALVADAPPATPDFTARQLYLNAAPGGVDARYAWTLAGGRGAGVRIVDVEGAWEFTHEDLTQNQGGVVGAPSTDLGWRNHGTAVMGEISGDGNAFGVTGICPDANVRGVSIFGGLGSAGAIRKAADLLAAGDIILIELHRPGPRATGVGQQGFIAMEWWPDDFAAIRYAVDKGIVVVEAAGNGAENLDDAVYNTPAAGFPADWRNPFNRSVRDSGAILVGAGAPPPGTHGRDHGPDRSRLGFSNFGAAVDAQGWGREVTTAGYGDLQGGANEQLWYSDTFSGTSSASPIVVGAIACVQGVLAARMRPKLSPARVRELLRSTGTPQQDAPGRPRTQRIGNRPNLRTLIASALELREWIGVQFTGEVPANATRRWFTYNWPAHWHVVWNVVPISPGPGAPQIEFKVLVERASDSFITYWVDVKNLTSTPVNIEARYALLGW